MGTKIRGNRITAGYYCGGEKDNSIVDAQIASDADIATSKLADGAAFIQGDGSVPFTADQPMGGKKLTGLSVGTGSEDAVNKGQLDAVSSGIDIKESVAAATTANITLEDEQTIDGVSVVADERVLVKNQTDPKDNGIYVCAAGAWSRSADADEDAEVTAGMYCFVEEGSVNGGFGYVLITPDPIVIGTTELIFTKFISIWHVTAGDGLTKTGDEMSVKLDGATLTVGGDGLKVSDDTLVALADFIFNEVPTGDINGSNVTFTLANVPRVGMLMLFLKGVKLDEGAEADYTITDAVITMAVPPEIGDKLDATYLK